MRDKTQLTRLETETVNSAKTRKPLYAARQKIFPKRASGNFRRFKWLVMTITLGIYYLAAWLPWARGPFAPDQAVLLDLANRRFYFFFIEIWPQEFFYVAGLLVMAGVGLFLITSTVGRAWCGYACPQTVWVDLFLVVERAIEGDRNARMKLDAGPWTARKLMLRVSKHTIWLVIGAATGGAWIFYFADAPTLLGELFTGTAAPVAYITVAVLTATTYTFGGLMREQVCTYMCPWPRIQAAMLDENSLTVTYNDWRGEPRSRHAKKVLAAGQPVGDCVDCNACVAVCPMGIDIRDGQQLECITCALCIDACDGVMDKLGKERGLIAYATLSDYNANMMLATAGGSSSVNPSLIRTADGLFSDKVAHFHIRKIFRPRTYVYMGLWSLIGLGLLYSLLTRDRLELNVLHDRNPQFVTLTDGSIRNGYTVKLLNMIPEPRTIVVTMQGLEGADMVVVGDDIPAGRSFAIPVEPDRLKMLRVFVRQPADQIRAPAQTFKFRVEDRASFESNEYTATFNAPEPLKMTANVQKPREFTGRHMLVIILAFFGVVIAVNLTMATLASTSWTGLVVENTYVASQQFNKKAEEGRAQAALGWTGKLTIAWGEVRYGLADVAGKPVPLHGVKVLFRHPAYEKEDKSVTLAPASGQEFAAQHMPKDGVWIVEVDADAGLDKPYRDVRRIMISNGALQ